MNRSDQAPPAGQAAEAGQHHQTPPALFPLTLFPDLTPPEVFRLSIHSYPWRATLEALGPPSTPPEVFLSPLELLERLEQLSLFQDGLR